MIVLTRTQYHEIANFCRKGLPNEACGLLGGEIAGDQKKVHKVYTMTNLDESPEHYSMAPKEQFAVIKSMRGEGIVLLGNFHSHPESPARPSIEDIKLAYDPKGSYLILSLMDINVPVLKSFKIVNSEVSEESIQIVEE